MSSAEFEAKQNANIQPQLATLTAGVCLSIDEATGVALISLGGAAVPVRIIIRPTPGWPVTVLTIGSQRLCLGPDYRSVTGEVIADPDLGSVTVLTDDGITRTLPYSTVLDLAIGDRVVIDWDHYDDGFVVAEPASEASAPIVPPPPPTPGGELEYSFYPVDSGSYGSSWFTTRVYSSDSNIGAYFYNGIAASIPDNAEILRVSIYLNAEQVSGGDPTFGMHSLASKSGAPTVTDAVSIAPGTGWRDLPLSFGDALKTGAKLGIGTDTGGYHIYAPGNNVNSGTLNIKFRTVG